jgi:hypothetical protein
MLVSTNNEGNVHSSPSRLVSSRELSPSSSSIVPTSHLRRPLVPSRRLVLVRPSSRPLSPRLVALPCPISSLLTSSRPVLSLVTSSCPVVSPRLVPRHLVSPPTTNAWMRRDNCSFVFIAFNDSLNAMRGSKSSETLIVSLMMSDGTARTRLDVSSPCHSSRRRQPGTPQIHPATPHSNLMCTLPRRVAEEPTLVKMTGIIQRE